jgi:hypothetical protein
MNDNKKSTILEVVKTSRRPVSVAESARQAGVTNWNTTLEILLELLIEGKVKGVKTGRGWIFWSTSLNLEREASAD